MLLALVVGLISVMWIQFVLGPALLMLCVRQVLGSIRIFVLVYRWCVVVLLLLMGSYRKNLFRGGRQLGTAFSIWLVTVHPLRHSVWPVVMRLLLV